MSSTGCSPAFPRVLKDLRLAAEEVPEGCDFRAGRRLLPLNNLPDGDLVRVAIPVGDRGGSGRGGGGRVGLGRVRGVLDGVGPAGAGGAAETSGAV